MDENAPYNKKAADDEAPIVKYGYRAHSTRDVLKVSLDEIAQIALDQDIPVHFAELDDGKKCLFVFSWREMNQAYKDESIVIFFIVFIRFAILPEESGYERCLIYNHRRNLINYCTIGEHRPMADEFDRAQNSIDQSVTIDVWRYSDPLVVEAVTSIMEARGFLKKPRPRIKWPKR